jgi:hypothetical protein
VNATKKLKTKIVATPQYYGYKQRAAKWQFIHWKLPAIGMPFWWRRNRTRRFTSAIALDDVNRLNRTWKVDVLVGMGQSTILSLPQKATDDDADAVQTLATLARMATIYLTEIGKAKPELLRPLAQGVREWPVVKQKNTQLSESENDLFQKIQLGKSDFVNFNKRPQWSLDAAGKIAYSLLWYSIMLVLVLQQIQKDFTEDSARPQRNYLRILTKQMLKHCGSLLKMFFFHRIQHPLR